jgi:hypothetical protein
VADRDLVARLEEVELQQLAGPIDRPLIGAPGQVARAELAQVVVEDRLRALVAELLDQLPDPLARQARIAAQQAIDLVAEGIELRGPSRPAIAGRLLRTKRAPDRLPITARAALDLLDREPLDEMHAADLRPLLHTNQLLLLASACRTEPGSEPHRTTPPERRQGGSVFNRRRMRSIQAAPTRSASVSPTTQWVPGDQHATGASQNMLACRHFLMIRTLDLLFMASPSDAVAGAYG